MLFPHQCYIYTQWQESDGARQNLVRPTDGSWNPHQELLPWKFTSKYVWWRFKQSYFLRLSRETFRKSLKYDSDHL